MLRTPPLRSGRKRCTRLLRRKASARRPRLARSESDGGNNARADTNRTDAPDAYRALRSAHADHQRAAGFPGRLRRTRQRAHDSAQHPLGPGAAARLLAVTRTAKAAHATHARPVARKRLE